MTELALNLIYIKAALQMPSRDALAFLYTNTARTTLHTNNYVFYWTGIHCGWSLKSGHQQ